VLDDAADEVQAHLRQVGIAVAGEQRLAALPDRLWVCMPEPLSPLIGFGMKVAVLP
jgi:hypothetical protein